MDNEQDKNLGSPNQHIRISRYYLLHGAHATSCLKVCLGRLAVLLGSSLLDGLGNALNELLGLLKAQAREVTHGLQHGDLLVGRERLKDEVKLRLLLLDLNGTSLFGLMRRDGELLKALDDLFILCYTFPVKLEVRFYPSFSTGPVPI